MVLYSIYNTQTKRFNPPFVARDNDDAIETCRKAIICGRDISLLVELDNLALYYVGNFDAMTGNLLSFDLEFPYEIQVLSEIPLPDYVTNSIDNLKNLRISNTENEKQWKEERENCSSQ